MHDVVTVIYEHDHDCDHQGETVEHRPPCDNGVAWVATPVCIETGIPLVKIEWRTA